MSQSVVGGTSQVPGNRFQVPRSTAASANLSCNTSIENYTPSDGKAQIVLKEAFQV